MTVDFHSHILPGLDDGSRSTAESLAMLRMEREQGITHVVATPHFYARRDDPAHFLKCRAQAYAALAEQMEESMPRITLGAEVYFFRRMSESDVLTRLTVGATRFILVEMPAPPWPEDFYRELAAINAVQGLTPIIAHIDRYISPLRTHGIPNRLAQLPVLVQANAEFFLHPATASMALKLLKADRIHLLGSDCHNTSERKPNLAAAVRRIEQKLGREALSGIHDYEQLVLHEKME